ncbi:MAG: hypothetical protein JWM32_3096 [Verrucomicrobia bacterium]|nr:hypothetical protein [Verrucomicrobiota bacterium]
MSTSVTLTIQRKIIGAAGLKKDDADAFRQLVGDATFESVEVTDDAARLSNKQQKELNAFRAFAQRASFKPAVERLTGRKIGDRLSIEMLAEGEDPPDILLAIEDDRLAIEVTDFPPDQAAMIIAMSKVRGPAPLPTFHEGYCSPDLIERFMRNVPSHVEPIGGDVTLEITALYDAAITAIAKKRRSPEERGTPAARSRRVSFSSGRRDRIYRPNARFCEP